MDGCEIRLIDIPPSLLGILGVASLCSETACRHYRALAELGVVLGQTVIARTLEGPVGSCKVPGQKNQGPSALPL